MASLAPAVRAARPSLRAASRLQSLGERAFSSDVGSVVGVPESGQALRITSAGRSGVSGVVATVFGCTGFLGRYIVNQLGRIGSQVICPYRGDGMRARHLKQMGDLGQVIPVPWDPRDNDTIKRAVARSNVVINLLGQDHPTRNFSFEDVHVTLPHVIAQISRECGVKRFVSVSALSASENSESRWLASKAKGERIVRQIFPTATIVRPCTLFGREDRFLNRYARLATFFPLIPLINNGEQRLTPVYVEDVASAITASLSRADGQGAIYELGGPEIMNLKEIFELVFKVTERESNVADTSILTASVYGSIISMLPEKLRVLTADQVTRMTIDSVVRPHEGVKTFDDLDITPQKLTQLAPAVLNMHKAFRPRFTAYF